MLQSYFAEFLQLYSSITLVYSTYSLVSDLIRCADQLLLALSSNNHTLNLIILQNLALLIFFWITKKFL